MKLKTSLFLLLSLSLVAFESSEAQQPTSDQVGRFKEIESDFFRRTQISLTIEPAKVNVNVVNTLVKGLVKMKNRPIT